MVKGLYIEVEPISKLRQDLLWDMGRNKMIRAVIDLVEGNPMQALSPIR